ncbi:hypothetical protein TNCT_19301 [Trichonephila clavata]|uniref:Uncharacterized protein n=1 Tax=Trichonephila clavata TaxID=2740835 RepID=A0A8X6M497_TRICU|nr:hypothetical protein TNCT_19301 [Trichonephila clavata]
MDSPNSFHQKERKKRKAIKTIPAIFLLQDQLSFNASFSVIKHHVKTFGTQPLSDDPIFSFLSGRSTLSRSLLPKENGSHLPRSLGQLEWRRAPCQRPFSKGRSVQGISLGQLDWHTKLPP